MPDHWRDDEQLLAALGEAVREARKVPPRFVAMGKAAFAWHNVDAELAALAYDSATTKVDAVTRSEPATLRALSFAASCLTIEIEVTNDALLGQLVPPQPGEVELQNRDGSAHTAPVDDVGWFTLRPLPSGLFRLQVRPADGGEIVTEWMRL
jgi:hypothetical protein